MKTIKKMKFTGLLMFFLGLGMFSQVAAQTKNWDFSNGSTNYSSWRIVENGGEISKVYVVGGTKGSPTWVPCTIEKLNDEYSYTYIRVKYVKNGNASIAELNLYWSDEKLTRVNADGSTKNFWLKK